MSGLEEEPRAVRVIVGKFPRAKVYVMVGYDVKSGDPWDSFPPKDGCVPWLVGEVTKAPDFLYNCTVKWLTEDGQEHSGKIQVTPVLLPGDWTVEPAQDSE